MKLRYKPGDEIKLSQFTKKQADVITQQIDLVDAAHAGLDHFSHRLANGRKIMIELIRQSMPSLKDYVFHIEHNTKTIKVVIDYRLAKE